MQPQQNHTHTLPMYYAFPIGSYKDYAFGLEKMDHVFVNVSPMLYNHWRETESKYMDQPPDFNLEHFRRLESARLWVIFTVRTETDIVGYASFYLSPDPHISGRFDATQHMIYLKPEHRKGYVASNLLKYVERHLPKLGIRQVEMVSKAPVGGPDIDKFLKANGFTETAVHYTKNLAPAGDSNGS